MSVVEFPSEPIKDPLIGPFEEYRVVVEGRVIPLLSGVREGDNVALIVDKRFSISIPKERAYDYAWLLAQAIAVASGYSYLGSEDKSRPFAPQTMQVDP